jgi:hypothetical protein
LTARRQFLLLLLAPWQRSPGPEALVLHLERDRLRVSAPSLRFLAGRPLERLRNGASVAFDFQLAALAGRPNTVPAPRVIERCLERFIISFDLWEERFAISRPGAGGPRGVSHLTSSAAESWCVEALALSTASLRREEPFWVRLELRAEDASDRPPVVGEPGISLARLIEIFSRPSRSQQPAWVVDSGPFRLADLKPARGANGG